MAARFLSDIVTGNEQSGLYLIAVSGGEPSLIENGHTPTEYASPAYAPDRQSLAYATCTHMFSALCSVVVVGVDASFRPSTPSRRLAQGSLIGRLAWTRDGRSVIYDAGGP